MITCRSMNLETEAAEMARLQSEGFHFLSLAEAGVTDENKHKLYELNRAAALDNPGKDGTFPDFCASSKNVFEASCFQADTQILVTQEQHREG